MNTVRHACAIDRYATALVGIEHDPDRGYNITQCRTLRAGLQEFSADPKPLKKLGSLLSKAGVDTLTFSFRSPALFPLDTLLPSTISREAFETHCRAEAAGLLTRPEEYRHDSIPYAADSNAASLRRHLLLYYPGHIGETLAERLGTLCTVSGVSHCLTPVILSVAATGKPFALLELEQEYATLSAGKNGGVERFRYWPANHESDAEYFGIRELLLDRRHGEYPVYVTGTRAAERALVEKIARGTGQTIRPFNLAELFSIACNRRFSCGGGAEQRALATALLALLPETAPAPLPVETV